MISPLIEYWDSPYFELWRWRHAKPHMSFKEFKDCFYLYFWLGDDEMWARIKQWELEAFTASDCAVHVEKDGSPNLEVYRKCTRPSAELCYQNPQWVGWQCFYQRRSQRRGEKAHWDCPQNMHSHPHWAFNKIQQRTEQTKKRRNHAKTSSSLKLLMFWKTSIRSSVVQIWLVWAKCSLAFMF